MTPLEDLLAATVVLEAAFFAAWIFWLKQDIHALKARIRSLNQSLRRANTAPKPERGTHKLFSIPGGRE